MERSSPLRRDKITTLWRDERFLRLLGQVVFLLLLAAFVGYLARNMLLNLRQLGLSLGIDFLRLTAGFDIGESLIPYDRSYTFSRALLVGLLNTALVAILGIFFATIVGTLFGVARLSTNFLIQWLARAYIEFLRNVPLLVLLIFLYTAVFIKLPRVKDALELPGQVLISNRGVAIPWGIPTETFPLYLRILGLAILLAIAINLALTWYGAAPDEHLLPLSGVC